MLQVALYQPQIPPNTGNIARQCVGMNAAMHIIGPIPFSLSDHATRRAGLDYWPHLNLTIHESPDAFLGWLGPREPWLVTKRGQLRYDQPRYAAEDILIFGSETTGLPPQWIQRWRPRTLVIPILGQVRSYNLANACAIVMAQASLAAGLYPPCPAADSP